MTPHVEEAQSEDRADDNDQQSPEQFARSVIAKLALRFIERDWREEGHSEHLVADLAADELKETQLAYAVMVGAFTSRRVHEIENLLVATGGKTHA